MNTTMTTTMNTTMNTTMKTQGEIFAAIGTAFRAARDATTEEEAIAAATAFTLATRALARSEGQNLQFKVHARAYIGEHTTFYVGNRVKSYGHHATRAEGVVVAIIGARLYIYDEALERIVDCTPASAVNI